MKRDLKRASIARANRLLKPSVGLVLESATRLADLQWSERRVEWIESLLVHQPDPELLPRAQVGQDLFVLSTLLFPRGGYFVEFGACDGLHFSNTVLLERSFGWDGIVAEPARSWHARLAANRSCAIDTRCVWTVTGESLLFAETPDAEYSTVHELLQLDDGHGSRRSSPVAYRVETVSLNDLLDDHGAPDRIDYLSVDTEGSEYDILSGFEFASRQVAVITVEHNFDSARRVRLHDLLHSHGFRRVFEETSLFDDWYVHDSVPLPAGIA